MSERLRSIWLPAMRPRTLPAAAAPVLIGSAIAIADGGFHLVAALLALLGALTIQVGTNLANDYFDHEKGADTEARVGPTRATAAGLVSPRAMRNAFILAFSLAFVIGIGLVMRAGMPIVVIGLLSILMGVLYTGGPAPLAYTGLADPVVLLFFGPVATAGTHYAQTLQFSPTAALAGIGPGLIAVALLTVNNLRDVDTDRPVGKNTLAVRFGRGFARWEYTFCMLGAAVVPVLLWMRGASVGVLLASAVLLTTLPAAKRVWRATTPLELIPALASTGRSLFLYGVAFLGGWLA
jgi:1,4-dihydroxy-2-naphthoate octaprenyltransferase